MKRLLLISIVFLFILSGCTSKRGNASVLTWDEGRTALGLKKNANPVSSSQFVVDYISPSQEVLQESFDPHVIESFKAPAVPTVHAGEEGYGLNILNLLKNTDPTTPNARLAGEMVELFYMAERGELDDSSFSLKASVYASKNRIETGGRTFLHNYYEGGSPATDYTLKRFNVSLLSPSGTGYVTWSLKNGDGVLGVSGNGNPDVWQDANNNENYPHNYPDGPFQIENSQPWMNVGRNSKLNGVNQNSDREWDIFFFPDNLSWINYYSANSIRISNLSLNEKTILALALHNRGSWQKQAFGLPYCIGEYQAPVSLISKINNKHPNYTKEMVQYATAHGKDMMAVYTKYRPPIIDMENQSCRAYGVLLLLKAGWYIADGYVPGRGHISHFLNTPQARSTFRILFPELSNADGSNVLQAVESNFVKNPWDIINADLQKLHNTTDIMFTQADFHRIYGVNSVYTDHYVHAFVFKVNNFTSELYIEKLRGGGDPPVVHAWDNHPMGHTAGALFGGEQVLVELLVQAGLPSILSNGAIVDPTNPANLYEKFGDNSKGSSYNPIGTVEDAVSRDSWLALLRDTKITMSPIRDLVLYSAYQYCGTYYYFGGGQRPTNENSYHNASDISGSHRSFVGAIPSNDLAYLHNWLYVRKDGLPYEPGITPDIDLLYYDRRIFDCSSLVSAGLSLGQIRPDGEHFIIRLLANDMNVDEPPGTRLVTHEDKVYDMSLTRVYGPDTAKNILTLPDLVPGGLQPGDIIAKFGSNRHVYFYLGTPTVSVEISKNLNKRDTSFKVNNGVPLSLEAWNTKEKIGVRPAFQDTSGGYYVIRPRCYEE